ncbi:LOW QUALITY PROTEIN: hypothetical protein HID58_034972 [Brassica napus]|uniref:NYN domain-containing protein n=1 Tax=Brassica napus TaxID=3708 RepID=A0ABQ8C3M3_BRANA|nr:LOW QUALITY PROTEIN: hypothetical protein HID58_034972 [Brassica napus]
MNNKTIYTKVLCENDRAKTSYNTINKRGIRASGKTSTSASKISNQKETLKNETLNDESLTFVLFFVVSTSPIDVSSSSLLLHCSVSHQYIPLIKLPSSLLQSLMNSKSRRLLYKGAHLQFYLTFLFHIRFYLLHNFVHFDDVDDEDEEVQRKKSRNRTRLDGRLTVKSSGQMLGISNQKETLKNETLNDESLTFVLFFVVSTSPIDVSSSSLLLHCSVSHQYIPLIKLPSSLLQSLMNSKSRRLLYKGAHLQFYLTFLFHIRFYLLHNFVHFDDMTRMKKFNERRAESRNYVTRRTTYCKVVWTDVGRLCFGIMPMRNRSIFHNLMLKLRQKKCCGPVVTFRLYGTGIQPEHKEAFQRTCIDLIDVPSAGNKRMTMDMLFWTKNNSPPAIVVVISRNRDFVVSTDILTAQGYRVMSADAAMNPVERIAI